MDILRGAIITDIHYGYNTRNKLGAKAPRLMKKFIDTVEKQQPDFVVDLGDRVSASDPAQDLGWLQSLSGYFNKLSMPHYHLMGNHDRDYIPAGETRKILGSTEQSFSLDSGGFHLVFLNSNVAVWGLGPQGLRIPDADIQWLKDDLNRTEKPSLVFAHIPLDGVGIEKLPVSNPGRRFDYVNAGAIRTVMEDSGKVLLCMSGHKHKDRLNEINGIHYVTLQSLTQAMPGRRQKPYGRYAMLAVAPDAVTLDLKSLSGAGEKTIHLTPGI